MTIDFTRSLYTRGNTLGYLPVWERVKLCLCRYTLTLSHTTNFRLFQLKEFAGDNFKFDKK